VINLLVTGVSSVDQRLITGRNEKLTEKNIATNASSDTLPCFYRTMHIARNVQSQLACCPPLRLHTCCCVEMTKHIIGILHSQNEVAFQNSEYSRFLIHAGYTKLSIKSLKLDIWGRAQLEAARRPKSHWKRGL